MQRGKADLRIGIVGSGMAGSSAAYFLRQGLGDRAEIVVFERGRTVGGRVQEMEIAGRMVETGASIAHSSNRYFIRFVETLGLHVKPSPVRTLGIWNGHRFDFRTSGRGWLDLVRGFARYGVSPLRAEKLVKEFIRRLVAIYTLLEQGQGFASPGELFEALGLFELSRQPAGDYFRRNGVSDRFVREVIDGVSRSNYGQSSDIHALVDLVSMAGAAMGGQLLSVQEGNSAVCRRLLEAAEAVVRTGTEVTEIARPGSPAVGYRITVAGGDVERFDAVIVAAPLELAGIGFAGIALPPRSVLTRPYQVTHVTFVVGQLNPGYFHLRTAGQLPETILTEESPAVPFSGIGVSGRAVDSGHALHKVFSRQELGEELLSRLFSQRVQTHRLVWKAYPVLRPAAEWPPFVLSHGLYYVNAMESAVSTMETETMGSRNVVNLLLNDLRLPSRPDR